MNQDYNSTNYQYRLNNPTGFVSSQSRQQRSQPTDRRFYPRNKKSFAHTALIFSLIFTFMFVTSAPLALADDGLTVGTSVRVANTDGDGVRLRESGSFAAKVLETVEENELLVIRSGLTKDSKGNNFYKVEYNGKTGYVVSQYLIYAGKVSNGVKTLKAGSTGKVVNTDGDGLRMRQQANAGSGVLNVLQDGAIVTVMGGPFADKQGNNFYRVDYQGQAGYANIAYVNAAPKNAVVSATSGAMRVTNTDGDPIRFRIGPGRTFDTNGYVYEGEVLKVLANPVKDDNGYKWYKVEKGGEVGFVDASYLAKTDAAPSAAPAPAPKKVAPAAPPTNGPLGDRIVSFAKQYLGWRYIYAGKSPAAGGFDCSGFVYWVLTNFNIAAGSTAAGDAEIGKAVPLNAIQPGDILVWANTYMPGPSHVGIYLGGGKFIHAENESTGVTIDGINDDYYASRFYGARRVGA